MPSNESTVRVAVAQAAPVFLDRDASLDKALRLIQKAGEQGVHLLAFGEAWLPGYPIHAWSAPGTDQWWTAAERYLDQAVDFGGPVIDALCSAAGKAGIDVVIGLAERDAVTQGTVYSTLALIGSEGHVIGHHRKLRPTGFERVVWADGNDSGLQTHLRPYGNLSVLASTEHQMVLPTYALAEQGAQFHVACWPGHSPAETARQSQASMWPDPHLLSRAFAVQTGTYVLCAGAVIDAAAVPEPYRNLLPFAFTGASAIIDPRGGILAGPVEGEELLVAECDPAVVRSAKVAFDCAGHSARPDQLALWDKSAIPSGEQGWDDAGGEDGPDDEDGYNGEGYHGDGHESPPPGPMTARGGR